MPSVAPGNRLRPGYGLLDGPEDGTVGGFFNKNRATVFKPQALADTNRQAHAAIRHGYYLPHHVALPA